MEEFEKLVYDLTKKKLEILDKLTSQMLRYYGYKGVENISEILIWLNENKYKLEMENIQQGDKFNNQNKYFLRTNDNKDLAMFSIENIVDLENMKIDILYSDVIYFD